MDAGHAADRQRRLLASVRLTPRERDVVLSLAAGDSTAACARRLRIAIPTVRSYERSVGARLEPIWPRLARRQRIVFYGLFLTTLDDF